MAFSMLTKRRLFEALWDRARAGQPAPSLRLIVKLAKLSDEAQAEGLLRNMEADGAITVVGEVTAYPWLTLRRTTYAGDFVSAPVWLEREKCDRIALVPTAVDCGGCSPPVLVVQKEEASGTTRKASSVDQGPSQASPPAQAAEEVAKRDAEPPQVVEARPLCEPSEFERRRAEFMTKPSIAEPRARQVNIDVPASVHAALAAKAEGEGSGVRAVARRIFLEAFDAQQCDTGRKHKVSAAVQRARDEDGRPLPEFVTDLIELGLERYLGLRNRAEAAE